MSQSEPLSFRIRAIAMHDDKIGLIDPALHAVETFASMLSSGDDAGHVRRSVAALRRAWGAQDGIEPAIQQLQRSLVWLKTGCATGLRRDAVRTSPSIARLDRAVTDGLLPALRCVGYRV